MNQKTDNNGLPTTACSKGKRGDLGKKTAQGLLWGVAGQVLNKTLTVLTLAVLARLLTKADFGLIATVTIVIDLLSPYRDLGLGEALIQNRNNFKTAANSVFSVNILTGLALTAAVFLSAPLVVSFFDSPTVGPLLRWLSLIFIINAVGSVHITILKRELDYRKKIIPVIGGGLVKAALAIYLAFNGFGVWSVIWGQLAGALVSVIIAWQVVSWRPKIEVDYQMTRRFLGFGVSVMGTNTVSVMKDNFAFIIVGKVCGMSLLGVFSLAFRLPEVLLIGNLWVLAEVFFSMFSLIQGDPSKIRKGFLASIRLVSLFATPISAGLVVAAEPLIMVMYGEQWLEAVPLLRLLAVYAWVHSFGFHAGDVYKAIGRPNVLLKLTLCTAIIDIAALLIGSFYGVIGIASGLLAGMVCNCAINFYVVYRMIGVTPGTVLRELKSSIFGVFSLTGAVYAGTVLLPPHEHALSQLLIKVFLGGAGYVITVWLMEKTTILFMAEKLGLTSSKVGNL